MFELVFAAAVAQSLPHAYVLDHTDQWTKSALATQLLTEHHFQVEPLPLEKDPSTLSPGIIVIGSFASELPGYAPYFAKQKDNLLKWVADGNVLLQLTQTDQVEAAPPFLPAGLSARRNDLDLGRVRVFAPSHPLNEKIASPIAFHTGRTIWESIVDQKGFSVLLASDETGANPALMEAAVGKGRILLSSMAIDKTVAPTDGLNSAALDKFRGQFFENLQNYVVSVASGTAPAPAVTRSQAELRLRDPGSWTLAVLPDTQIYAESYPGFFTAQTGFLVQNKERLNIKFAVQLGDITNQNTDEQWRNARDAMSLMDGKVPYAMAPGNHDFGPRGSAANRDTYFSQYFDVATQKKQPTFGGTFEPDKMDNTFHLFEAGGRKWIVIALEWGPRDEVVEWANQVMDDHPDRTGILITHAYLYNDSTRYDWKKYGAKQSWNPYAYNTPKPVNDGEDLWQKLVRKHNFAFALNGHVLDNGTGYLASKNDAGKTVHQILQNYQMRELGGEGYLRLYEFLPDEKSVRIRTYTPVFDRFMATPDQSFEITLD
jgi:3',5'-cyclic AMP phosphodiesterase CpdA